MLLLSHQLLINAKIVDFLEGKYNISVKNTPNYKFYLNEKNFRLIDTENSKNIDERRTIVEFEPKQHGYRIKSHFGYICKKSTAEVAIINCKGTDENKYSDWNIHTKEGGIIIETHGYCMVKSGKDKNPHEKKKGVSANYVHAIKCDPETTTDQGFIFSLKRHITAEPGAVSNQTRLLREENQDSSSDDSKSSSSDEDSGSTDKYNSLLCKARGEGMPDEIRLGPQIKSFYKMQKGNC
ncbi:hypothetical protein CDIK_1160 [Cucumispora dikerogammari]|nr:hypothetical protein CDIK_1160 [Cucumispora dikerogammari]